MIQIIEVALSLFVLMFFFHALLSERSAVYSHDDVLTTTYSAITSLDASGQLREYIYSNDTNSIKSLLVKQIPFPIDVQICYYNETCSIDFLESSDTGRYVLSYYVSGYYEFYPAKLVVVIYV